MPKLIFTKSELKAYFKDKVKHAFYNDMVNHAESMRVHTDGVFPKHLIEDRRPNEPLEVQQYRKDIFIPKTKPVVHKVIASLSKIRRSTDWNIVHQKNLDLIAKINEDETLEKYCELNFPYFGSLTNWAFQMLLKKYADDPNALVFVTPLEVDINAGDHLKPYPIIFESCDTIEFVQDDFAVLINPLGSTYTVRGTQFKGDSFFIVTTQNTLRFDQINNKGDLVIGLNYPHGLGVLPVFRIGAIVIKSNGNNYYHESRLSPMLPELDEALREYSDLQAAKVQHIYPERYEFTNTPCKDCKGTGKIQKIVNNMPCTESCTTCNGRAYVVAGPYSKMIITPSTNVQQGQIPNPPAGYITKDVEVVRVQDEGVEAHIYSALSALNFQFLAQTPLNQSGTAKEVDKDELNNTVNAVAEDIVRNMDNIYLLSALYRYNTLYTEQEIKENIVPRVNVPERYDLLSSKHLEEELQSAKSSDINPLIKNELEIAYAGKKFPTNPEVKERLQLIFTLDPLSNVTDDEKIGRLSSKGITLETYIISSNIVEFVQRAVAEDNDFAKRTLEEQKEKMKEYAKEQIDEQDTAKNIIGDPMQQSGLNPDGTPIETPVNESEPVLV